MPDPIKDVYSIISKKNNLFLDESDFRSQLSTNPGEVYEVLKGTNLFLDEDDFNNVLQLKKKREEGSPLQETGGTSPSPFTAEQSSTRIEQQPQEIKDLSNVDAPMTQEQMIDASVPLETEEEKIQSRIISKVQEEYSERGWTSPMEKMQRFGYEIEQLKENDQLTKENVGKLADEWGLKYEGDTVQLLDSDLNLFQRYYEDKTREVVKKQADKNKNSKMKDAWYGLLKGANQQAINTYNLLGLITPFEAFDVSAEQLEKANEQLTEQMTRGHESIVNKFQDGDISGAVGEAAVKTAEALPSLIMLAATGASGYAKKGLGVIAAGSGATKYKELDDVEIPESAKVINSINTVLSTYVSEGLVTLPLLNASRKALTRLGKDETKALIKDVYYNEMHRVYNGFYNSVAAGVNEGMSEEADYIATEITDILTGVKKEEEAFKNVGDGFFVGFITGKGISAPVDVANAKAYFKDKVNSMPGDLNLEQQVELIKKIVERDKVREETENLDEAYKEEGKEKIKRINEEIKAIKKGKTDLDEVGDAFSERERAQEEQNQPESSKILEKNETPSETVTESDVDNRFSQDNKNESVVSDNEMGSGIKKALVPEGVVEEVTASRGEKKTYQEYLDIGKNMVDTEEINPKSLVDDIVENPRALQKEEVAALVYYKAKLDKEFDRLYDGIQEAEKDGDIERADRLRMKLRVVQDETDNYHVMSAETAYEQGTAFGLRKMMLDSEYNLQKQVKRYKAANNGVIPEDVEQRFKEYDQRLKEANDLIRGLQEKQSKADGQDLLNKTKPPKGKRGKDLIAEGLEELTSAFGGIKKIEGAEASRVSDAVYKIGRGLIQEGKATLDNIVEKVQEFLDEQLENRIKVSDYVKDLRSKIETMTPKVYIENGEIIVPKEVLREYVAKGFDDIDKVAADIQKELSKENPDITKRDVRDAITNYGKTQEMNQEAIEKKIRELKRVGRLVSQIEDVQKKKQRPLKTGLQRDKLTDKERDLSKKLREAMKELPETKEDMDKKWKTSLDAVKTRLKNQIKELENQIETGERTEPKKRIQYDQEATDLKARRDELKDIVRKIDSKKELTDEQKVRMALNAIEYQIKEYQRRIDQKDFSARRGRKVPDTPEIKDARRRLQEKKELYKQLQDELGVTEQKQLESIKKRMETSIEKYKERLKNRDFESPKRTTPDYTEEMLAIEAEKERIKMRFDEEREKQRLKDRPWDKKLTDYIIDIINLPKSLVASVDLSAPLRQGAILSEAYPDSAMKAAREMFRQMASEKVADQWLARLRSSDLYRVIKLSKLYVSEPTARLSAKEEQFMTNLAHKIPGWGEVVKASERAYVGYLNALRADVFAKGVEHLEDLGYNIKDNAKEYQVLADFINNATGRGDLGKFEGKAAEILNAMFFSPRLIKSRLSLMNPVKYAKLPKPLRKMVMGSMLKFISFNTALVGLAAAAGAEVEKDPRSADFGKIKIGNLRFDTWAGFQQISRAIAQTSTGKRKSTYTGRISELDGTKFPYTTRMDVLRSFGRSKLSPSVGMIVNALEGENMIGEEFEVKKEALERVVPLYLQDIFEIYNEGGVDMAIGAAIPAVFGVGVQFYDSRPTSKKKTIKDLD